MMTQSPSSLDTFLTCPRQYKAKYITREVTFSETAHTIFGTLVHSSIENYLLKGEPLPTVLSTLQPTLDKMSNVLIGAETKLAVDKHGNAVNFYDKSAIQRCIVDAIVGNPDDTIICIDWKTGKKRDEQVQHNFIMKCAKAKYPNAKIVTHFVYLFKGEHDTQEYIGEHQFSTLNRQMGELATAYATNSFKPKQSGLCSKWCDVVACPFNGRNEQ